MPRKPGVKKNGTMIYLTEEAKAWLERLAQLNGASNSVMVEKLVRRAAVEEGFEDAREWK